MSNEAHIFEPPEECRTCGAPLQGLYCHECGEKLFTDHDLSTNHLFHDVSHELTHLDSKIFRTLRALVTKPGLLTQEYWAGRLGRWIRPLRLYIFLSALQYLFSANTLGPMGVHYSITHDPKKPDEPRIAIGNLMGGYSTAHEFHEVEHQIQVAYGALRWLGLFSFAGISWLLYRKKQHYYGAHLIAGLHFYSAQYLLSATVSALNKFGPHLDSLFGIDALFGIIYLYFTLRRLHADSFWKAIGKAYLIYLCAYTSEVIAIAWIASVAFWLMKHA